MAFRHPDLLAALRAGVETVDFPFLHVRPESAKSSGEPVLELEEFQILFISSRMIAGERAEIITDQAENGEIIKNIKTEEHV